MQVPFSETEILCRDMQKHSALHPHSLAYFVLWHKYDSIAMEDKATNLEYFLVWAENKRVGTRCRSASWRGHLGRNKGWLWFLLNRPIAVVILNLRYRPIYCGGWCVPATQECISRPAHLVGLYYPHSACTVLWDRVHALCSPMPCWHAVQHFNSLQEVQGKGCSLWGLCRQFGVCLGALPCCGSICKAVSGWQHLCLYLQLGQF